ncbi:MAG: ATP-binding protein [Gammaproteobacteria bacterium]
MITREVTDGEVLALSTREESHFFDKKSSAISGKGVQKIAVAFANADGGEFLIGIADDADAPSPEDRWQGVDNIEALNSHLQAIFAIQPALDVRYEFLKHNDDKSYVLRVTVEKSSEVHKTSDSTVYQRYGAQSLPIKDPQQIAQLSFAKGSTTYEDQLLKELPPELIVESTELVSFGFYPDFTDTSKKPHNRRKECLCRREESTVPSLSKVPLSRPVSQVSVVLR